MKYLLILISLSSILFGQDPAYVEFSFDGEPVIRLNSTEKLLIKVKNNDPSNPVESFQYEIIFQSEFAEWDIQGSNSLEAGEEKTLEIDYPWTNLAEDNWQVTFDLVAQVDENNDNNFGEITLEIKPEFMSLEEAQDIFISHFEQNLNSDQLVPLAYTYPMLVEPKTPVKDINDNIIFSPKNYYYFCLLDLVADSKTEKDYQWLLIDANTEKLEIADQTSTPLLNLSGFTPNPTSDSDLIIFGEAPPEETDFPQITGPSTTVTNNPQNAKAVIISGSDSIEVIKLMFECDGNLFQRYLNSLKVGPKMGFGDIDRLFQPEGQDIVDYFEDFDSTVNKVYFFYSGHSSKDSTFRTGESSLDWKKVIDKLLEVKSENICIVIDACHGEIVGDLIAANPISKTKKIEFIYSSERNKKSHGRIYPDPTPGQKSVYSDFTYHLMREMVEKNDSDSNGIVDLCEAFDALKKSDPRVQTPKNDSLKSIIKRQNAGKKIFKPNQPAKTSEQVGNMFLRWMDNELDQASFDNAILYLDPITYSKGERLRTPTDIITIEEDNSWFGWIDLEPNSKFGHETIWLTVADSTNLDSLNSIFDINLRWFPEVDSAGHEIDPFDLSSVVKPQESPVEPTPAQDSLHIFNLDAEPLPECDSVCVLMFSGSDKRKSSQETFDRDIDILKENMQREQFGPRIPDSCFRIYKALDANSYYDKINELKPCKKLYFFYSGHGTNKPGGLAPDSLYIPYSLLLDWIYKAGFRDVCFYIDACYAGGAIQEFGKGLTDKPDLNIDVVASSDDEIESSFGFFDIVGKPYGISTFTWNFVKCFGHRDADFNNDGKTSFMETFNWICKQNPDGFDGENLKETQKPRVWKRKVKPSSPSSPSIFKSERVTFLPQANSGEGDLNVTQDTKSFDVNFDNQNIAEIDNTSLWEFEADFDVSFDIEFEGINDYHNLNELPGHEPGVVTRGDSSQNWEPYYPFLWNEQAGIISIQNVDSFSQWAVGLINTNPTSIEYLKSSNDLYPNPASNILQLDVVITSDSDLSIEVYNLLGEKQDISFNKFSLEGDYKFVFDISKLSKGIYIIKLSNNMINKTYKFTKK